MSYPCLIIKTFTSYLAPSTTYLTSADGRLKRPAGGGQCAGGPMASAMARRQRRARGCHAAHLLGHARDPAQPVAGGGKYPPSSFFPPHSPPPWPCPTRPPGA